MKVIFGLLAALFGILSVVGGIGVGIGGFAYGIYMIILLVKGTVAVSFWAVFKVVLCWMASGLAGWLTFFICVALASVCASIAGCQPRFTVKRKTRW